MKTGRPEDQAPRTTVFFFLKSQWSSSQGDSLQCRVSIKTGSWPSAVRLLLFICGVLSASCSWRASWLADWRVRYPGEWRGVLLPGERWERTGLALHQWGTWKVQREKILTDWRETGSRKTWSSESLALTTRTSNSQWVWSFQNELQV